MKCFNYRLLPVQILPREKHDVFLIELRAGGASLHDIGFELYILPLMYKTAGYRGSLGTGRMLIWQE